MTGCENEFDCVNDCEFPRFCVRRKAASGDGGPVIFCPGECQIHAHPPPPESGMTTGKIPAGVRIVHIPTGAAVECIHHRAMYKNKDAALKALKAIVEGI